MFPTQTTLFQFFSSESSATNSLFDENENKGKTNMALFTHDDDDGKQNRIIQRHQQQQQQQQR